MACVVADRIRGDFFLGIGVIPALIEFYARIVSMEELEFVS